MLSQVVEGGVMEEEFLRATRASYDLMAGEFAEWIEGELAVKPLDRAMLRGFAELVRGPVADVGCGSGRITGFLVELGVDAFGIDLSPELVRLCRESYPGLRFEVGSMLDLGLEPGALGGIVAWYSIIHVPQERLAGVFGGFFEALGVGGYLLVAFQVGDSVEHRTRAGSHAVDLEFHHRQPEDVAGLLERAGFEVRARLVREADAGDYPEDSPQAFLLAVRPA
ncbi:class I SAM-dependent methyltransferase [Actinomadura barringtoniae]|uniref:Class I SAM-dependent methyltransferase n=1 Tax=Actinomadura barringtoniae TaxID=1427535 RepID=A0A939PGN9_9ACTN|nr:class I SAM-dependent methyltransferase [Actinomadura barringtoniae]MBO2452517.1 class I SAM-dependent methyltransferase [Actinomadura barringtoniae]